MYLSRAKCLNLNKLMLGKRFMNKDNNPIGGEGCYHLSKARWPYLYQLGLNCIGIGK